MTDSEKLTEAEQLIEDTVNDLAENFSKLTDVPDMGLLYLMLSLTKSMEDTELAHLCRGVLTGLSMRQSAWEELVSNSGSNIAEMLKKKPETTH